MASIRFVRGATEGGDYGEMFNGEMGGVFLILLLICLHWRGRGYLKASHLKGGVKLSLLGGAVILFDFQESSDAMLVLSSGRRRFQNKLIFWDSWALEVGCFYNGCTWKKSRWEFWGCHCICGARRCLESWVTIVEVLWP